MKHQRVEWQICLDIKSTCGEENDPPDKIRYRISGAWNPEKRSALEILAMDLAEVVRVASQIVIPTSNADIIETFACELTSLISEGG